MSIAKASLYLRTDSVQVLNAGRELENFAVETLQSSEIELRRVIARLHGAPPSKFSRRG
ncbi:hypothetical protein [Sphingomonas sp.]|uniref:hypothetical protein n=1 Tax=Sphingomonas sp. TaxID=28214 RepID=UPI0017990786|nr:hypothetical protein [Sphingomonas sp.]MBA3512331.1 hypothetical protein [Sphingomonas sp.]